MLRKSPEPIVDACLQAMLSLDLREEETMLLDLLIHHSPGDGIQVQIIRMLAEWQSPPLGSALASKNACFRGCPQPDSSTPIQTQARGCHRTFLRGLETRWNDGSPSSH